MLNKLTLYLIRRIKRDSGYSFNSDVNTLDLIIILFNKGVCILRGGLYCLISLRKIQLLFKGKRCEIIHSSNLLFESPLTLGNDVKIDCLGKNGVHLGSNVNIPDGSFIRCTGVISDLGVGLKIGKNTGLGHNTFINAQGGVEIGDDVIIGPGVKILSENHNFENINLPTRLQGVTRKGIIVRDNVWIGANVTILDGVEIGQGAIIGAGSIVTKSIPPFSISFGNPCKVFKVRS